jgi:8-oxo-dGTP diphosphatase
VLLLPGHRGAGDFPLIGFRLTIENMTDGSTVHEVLAVVLQVRPIPAHPGASELCVLLWQRARQPQARRWALPGGSLRSTEDVETSARRQLADKVDVREVAHLEQLAVFSDPTRVPGVRTVASTFLGLVPSPADPTLPADTAWHRVTGLPAMAFDHGIIAERGRNRLRHKLSYTNIGFALAPPEFTISTLRQLYSTALAHPVDPTNLQRVLSRRGVLEPTGTTMAPGPHGGRPAAFYRFTETTLRVTDAFAALRPPP